MGKPKKVKHKLVSQKRFERLQKRADKKPHDRLIRGVSTSGNYDNDGMHVDQKTKEHTVAKISKKGNLKKTFRSKDRDYFNIEKVSQSPKKKTMQGDMVRKIYSSLSGRLMKSPKMIDIKHKPYLGSPISKRTPMKSKYGGTLLPEVTITAPAHKTRAQEIMTPLASSPMSPMPQKLSSTIKEPKLPVPEPKATRTKKARIKAKKGK